MLWHVDATTPAGIQPLKLDVRKGEEIEEMPLAETHRDDVFEIPLDEL